MIFLVTNKITGEVLHGIFAVQISGILCTGLHGGVKIAFLKLFLQKMKNNS